MILTWFIDAFEGGCVCGPNIPVACKPKLAFGAPK